MVKYRVSDMNLLLDTLALINPVGYIEDVTPIKTDFFILIFTMHMSIRISVCSLFCPCHPYICISPHFSPSHILWYYLVAVLNYFIQINNQLKWIYALKYYIQYRFNRDIFFSVVCCLKLQKNFIKCCITVGVTIDSL